MQRLTNGKYYTHTQQKNETRPFPRQQCFTSGARKCSSPHPSASSMSTSAWGAGEGAAGDVEGAAGGAACGGGAGGARERGAGGE